jgi:ADP-heptose:LPS heptosyltransferase
VRGGVVLQAGTKWRATGVSDAALATLAERLRPYGLRIFAAPGEAEAVRAATGLEPVTPVDLRTWVETLDGASCVVTVDTGAAHVAGMLGRPVIDVFPDADFAAQVRRWRPWASPYRAFRASELGDGAEPAFIEAVLDGI